MPLLSRVILGSCKMYRIGTRNFAWVLAFSPFVFAFCAKAGERRRKRDKRRELGGGGGGGAREGGKKRENEMGADWPERDSKREREAGREGRREKTKWGQTGQNKSSFSNARWTRLSFKQNLLSYTEPPKSPKSLSLREVSFSHVSRLTTSWSGQSWSRCWLVIGTVSQGQPPS